MGDQRAEDRLLSKADQASSKADQGGSDTDQALSNTDQAYADKDQLLADRDQATADREHDASRHLSPAGERAYRQARTEREDQTAARRVTRQTRQRTAKERGGRRSSAIESRTGEGNSGTERSWPQTRGARPRLLASPIQSGRAPKGNARSSVGLLQAFRVSPTARE